MKLSKRWLSLAVLAPLVMAGVQAQPAQADPSVDACKTFTIDVLRTENVRSGAALLTQFPSELKSSVSYGFSASSELAFKTASKSGTGIVNVWRMYNAKAGDFSWAAEGADRDALVAAGYTSEFKQFFASGDDADCLSSAYRLRKGNKSRIVVGVVARDNSVRDGWSLASSGMFYAVPAVPDPVEPPVVPDPVEPGDGGHGSPADEEAFSIAVIPDTQQETWSDSDSRFKNRSQWLVDNAEKENLKFVTHAGDVVDWGNAVPEQYTRAKAGLAPLDKKIPYSLTVGNHDTAAVCRGGSACPGRDTSVDVRDTAVFNAAFGSARFTSMKGQFEAGKVDNSFSTFEGGGEKWMVLNLELWPRKSAVAWGQSVVASHPDHNVIVATHSYLNADGSISTSNGGYGATSPMYLFDSLIKVYPNIKIVVSGHTGESASRVDTGNSGNKILSLLQCFHSRTTNPVRLIEINASSGTVTHRVYAPYTDETLVSETVVPGFDFTH